MRFRARSRFQSEAFLPLRQAEVVFRARSKFQVFSGHAAEPSPGEPGARRPVAGFGVANLETMLGQYHRASAPGGEVRHARSNFTTPPFVKDAPIPGGQDGEQPGLTMLSGERLLAVWQRVKEGGADVVLVASDDDGDTWSEPNVLFEDATNPVAATHPQTGVTLFAARRGSQLVGRVQYPGDKSPRDEFTFQDADEEPLAVAAGSFAISAAIEGASRWVLAVVLAGEPEEGEEGEEGEGAVGGGDFTELVSADDGLTWAPAETDEEPEPEPEEGEEGEEG